MQLQLLTAIVKLFLKRPADTQELVQQVLTLATQVTSAVLGFFFFFFVKIKISILELIYRIRITLICVTVGSSIGVYFLPILLPPEKLFWQTNHLFLRRRTFLNLLFWMS